MRYALVGAIGVMALLFTASALAVDLSRILPSFELPAAPRLRAESPQPQGPDAVTPPKAATVETAGSAAVTPNPGDSSSSPATSPAGPPDASLPAAPTRRERGWREMLPGLLHQP